jgi:hypothetical protein
MARNDVFVIRHEATISTAITFIQLKAGTTFGFEILEMGLTQKGSTTSASESIALVRKTGAATVTTAVVGTHVFGVQSQENTPGLSLGTSATGVIGSAEGTDGDILLKEGFNVLNGWAHVPVPERRFQVAVSEIVALKFLTAPASQLWQAWMVIREL